MPDDVFRWVIAIGVALAAVAFLVQAGISIALYRIANRLQSKVMPLADRAEPILDTAQQILAENRPRIAEMSTQGVEIARHGVEIARNFRGQAVKVGELVDETSARARLRLADIDERLEHTVEQVEQVGGAVKTAVTMPVREVAAVMAGLKAALVTYARGGNRRYSVEHATQDEEMFI
jgi:predicted nuclease with RNAse H fold